MSSILKNNLSNITWSHQLNDIVSYISVYNDIMKKWKNLIDIKIYQFHYSNLTKDFNSETKNLFNFCDLKWNKDLMNFNKYKFESHTASNIKVRGPFSTAEDEKHSEMSNFLKKKINIADWE